MPRPIKQGLDYFPLDCNFDNKVRALIGKYKAKGFGIFVHLLQIIYSGGYFIKITPEVIEDIAIEMGCEDKDISDVIEFACRRGIFSNDAWSKKVLTSNGIQKRFSEATKRRTKFNIVNKFKVNVYNKLVNVNKNPQNDNNGTQSKEEESKEEEIIPPKSPKMGDNGLPLDYRKWTSDEFKKEVWRFKDKYTVDQLKNFFEYWTSLTPQGKMLFTKQKSWSTSGRLSNADRIGVINNSGTKPKLTIDPNEDIGL